MNHQLPDLDDSTSGEEDTDSYCGVCELYFYDKNGPRCDWMQCNALHTRTGCIKTVAREEIAQYA